MPSAQRSILIHRPVADVFAFLTDPANDPRWRSHVREISGPAHPAPGARIHQVVNGPGGRGIAADVEVLAYQPPDHYAFQGVAGPVRPAGEFRFSSDGDGTRVSLSLHAELGGLKRLLLSGSVQKAMDGEMRALDRAKAILEGS